MFDSTVGSSDAADFHTIAGTLHHYRSLPWWKRALIVAFHAYVTIENGQYNETFTMPEGVYFLVQKNQRASFTVSNGDVTVGRAYDD